MFVKNLENCEEFTANDGCRIRELLHSKNDPITLPYSIAVARVEAGKSTYKHKLGQTEVYYILSGSGIMHIDGETCEVNQGNLIVIPPEAIQWLENSGKTEIRFIAIVSPPWSGEEDIRIF